MPEGGISVTSHFAPLIPSYASLPLLSLLGGRMTGDISDRTFLYLLMKSGNIFDTM